jgi:RHS repeat-associated protein
MSMTRTYNSNNTKSGMFGQGWTFSYESDLATNTCNGNTPAVLHQGSGNYLSFSKTAQVCPSSSGSSDFQVAATPASPPGNFDKLTYFYTAASKTDYWIHEAKNDFTKSRFDFLLAGTTVPTWLLTSITDTNNNVVHIAHDPNGKITTITDAPGRITSFVYDANGHCTSMTLPNGKSVSYTYDSSGHLSTTIDLAGNQTLYGYDADGYMTSMTVGSKTTTFTYDASVTPKRLATVTNAMGKTQSYQKGSTAAGNVAIDASYYAANSTGSGQCRPAGTGTKDPLGFTTSKTYTAPTYTGGLLTSTGGLLASYTDSLGLTQSMTYDVNGNLTAFQFRPEYPSMTFAYDVNFDPISVITPVGDVFSLQHDDSHNLTAVTFPSGNIETLSYSQGLLSSQTDALSNVTSFSYDTVGNLTSVTDPLLNTWSKTYDADGLLQLSDTDPLGNKTSYAYDDLHRLTGITHADGSKKTFVYDCCSMTGVIDENGNETAIARNALLQPVSRTDALGNTTTYTYDATNNLIGVARPNGSAVSVLPDQLYRPSTITDSLSGTKIMAYDGDWNLTSLTDERGKATTFSYMDAMPWKTADPLGNTTTTLWDGSGRLWYWGNARSGNILYSNSILFYYTPDGQLASKQAWVGSTPTLVAQYTYDYDKAGNLIQVQDPTTGTTSYTYDAARRVTAVSYPDAKSTTFSYNKVGRFSSINYNYPGGVTATYTYDQRNRVASITWGGNSIAFSYDPAGNLLSETRSNGTGTSYAYDKRNLVSQITHTYLKGASAFIQTTYNRDALGNVVQENSPIALISPVLSSTTKSGTYNDANQVISFGGDTYTYDDDGNLTGISGSKLSASYDTENRLTSITRGGVTTSYTYNGRGQRTKAVTGTQTVNYYYDHLGRLLFQTNVSGQVTAYSYYIYAGKRLVAMGTPEGGYYFFHQDKAGNTMALTDGTGAVAAAYAYTPFGEIVNQTGSITNPLTYVGAYGVMDEGKGLYFMKSRYYDAVTGRFLQKDPIGLAGGPTNLYAYVGNNPVIRVDPEGNDWKTDLSVAAGTAGGAFLAGTPVGWGLVSMAVAGYTVSKTVTGVYDYFTGTLPATYNSINTANNSVKTAQDAWSTNQKTADVVDKLSLDQQVALDAARRQEDTWANVFHTGGQASSDTASATFQVLGTIKEGVDLYGDVSECTGTGDHE